MLIKTFGEYWNPFSVNWSNPELFGEAEMEITKKGIIA